MKIVRIMWTILNALPAMPHREEENEEEEEEEDELEDSTHDKLAVRYAIASYATFAYVYCFLKQSSIEAIDVGAVTQQCYRHYRKVFTINYFLKEYQRYANRELSMQVKGKVQADYVARTLMLDPQCQFAKLLRASIYVPNATNFFKRATAFIKANVQIIFKYLQTLCIGELTKLAIFLGPSYKSAPT